MIEYIGNHFFVIPLAAAALFMVVVGFVSIEDALHRRRYPPARTFLSPENP